MHICLLPTASYISHVDIRPMKLDFLFLIITHMLCLHLQQNFIFGLFHHVIHWHINIGIVEEVECLYRGQEQMEPKYHLFIRANHYLRLNIAKLSHIKLEKILVGTPRTFFRPAERPPILFVLLILYNVTKYIKLPTRIAFQETAY